MKRYIILILILSFFFLHGCAASPGLFLAGSTAILTVNARDAIKRADYKRTLKADFEQVWKWALEATEEMGIEVLEKRLDKDKKEGVIEGKTQEHEKIKIAVAVATPKTTIVGVQARRKTIFGIAITNSDVDGTFAVAIMQAICEEYNIQQMPRFITNPKS